MRHRFSRAGARPAVIGAALVALALWWLLGALFSPTLNALEERSGVEQAIEVKPQYGISEEAMATMLLDSIRHAQEDMEIRGLMEARNEGNSIVLSAAKFLQQHHALLTEAEIAALRSYAESLKAAIEGTDKDRINQAIEALNTFSNPLAHRAMDFTIAEAMQGKKIGS